MIGASTVCRGVENFEMNRTLRVPRSRVDPGCLDHEIDKISSTGKAGQRDLPRTTRKFGMPNHREMIALDATGPDRTLAKRPIRRSAARQTGRSLHCRKRMTGELTFRGTKWALNQV